MRPTKVSTLIVVRSAVKLVLVLDAVNVTAATPAFTVVKPSLIAKVLETTPPTGLLSGLATPVGPNSI